MRGKGCEQQSKPLQRQLLLSGMLQAGLLQMKLRWRQHGKQQQLLCRWVAPPVAMLQQCKYMRVSLRGCIAACVAACRQAWCVCPCARSWHVRDMLDVWWHAYMRARFARECLCACLRVTCVIAYV